MIRTNGRVMRLLLGVTLMAASAGAVQGQTLEAQFDLAWAPPDTGEPATLRALMISDADVDVVTTVTETVQFIDPDGSPPCSNVAPENGVALFVWFSIHNDDTFFPKIWTGAFSFEQVDMKAPCDEFPAFSSWQTVGPLLVTGGVIFVVATWDTDGGAGGTPGFEAGNVLGWALGPPGPVPSQPLTDVTLSARLGFDQQVQLDSTVEPFGPVYLYTNRLFNGTDEPVTVEWGAAQMTVTLEPGEEWAESFIAAQPGREAQGYADFMGGLFDGVTVIANAIEPMDSAVAGWWVN